MSVGVNKAKEQIESRAGILSAINLIQLLTGTHLSLAADV